MDDPYNQPEKPLMEFRLTYEGLLLSTQRDPEGQQPDRKKNHKHDIRKVFHAQLKRLWEVTPFLGGTSNRPRAIILMANSGNQTGFAPSQGSSSLAEKHALYGFNFVPLVTQELNLICGLEILFLRPDNPGKVLSSGDIDNRLKTLFDALRIPEANELYSQRLPNPDEKPFYCLLEDDRLITKVSVETDQLLQSVSPANDPNDTRLIITVRLRPYEMHVGNMTFG